METNSRLVLFTILFSALIPLGFIFIYLISPEARIGKTFTSSVVGLEFITCLILYIPSIIVFMIINFIFNHSNSKKILICSCAIPICIFVYFFISNIFISAHNGIYRNILIFFLSCIWSMLSIYIIYKLMLFKRIR